MVPNHNLLIVFGLMMEYVGEAVSPVRKQMILGKHGDDGNVDFSAAEVANLTSKHFNSGESVANSNIALSDAEPARLVRKQMSAAGNINMSYVDAAGLVRKHLISGRVAADGNVELSGAEPTRLVRKHMSAIGNIDISDVEEAGPSRKQSILGKAAKDGSIDVSDEKRASPVRKQSMKVDPDGHVEISVNTRGKAPEGQVAPNGNTEARTIPEDSNLVRKAAKGKSTADGSTELATAPERSPIFVRKTKELRRIEGVEAHDEPDTDPELAAALSETKHETETMEEVVKKENWRNRSAFRAASKIATGLLAGVQNDGVDDPLPSQQLLSPLNHYQTVARPDSSFAAAESSQCSLSLANSMSIAAELFGYNQVNGVSWQNREYDDEDLMKIPKLMWSAQLRFPGGTVANYWYWPNATFADTCFADPPVPSGFLPQCKDTFGLGMPRDKTALLKGVGGKDTLDESWDYVQWGCINKLGGQCFSHSSYCDLSSYDWDTSNGICGNYLMGTSCGCCKPKSTTPDQGDLPAANEEGVSGKDKICPKAENVALYPEMTFSVAEFANGVGSASPVSAKTGLMYDLNILTVDTAAIKLQIDYLKSESVSKQFPVYFLEFGNEVFLPSHYDSYFPDAHVYMSKVTEALEYAKDTLGDNVKIAVPIGFPFGSQDWDHHDDWNRVLKSYCKTKCPWDAVTIHDYQANNETIDHGIYSASQRRSALAAFGEAQLKRHVTKVNEFFANKGMEIWLTEWSTSAWTGEWLQDEFGNDMESMSSGMNGIFLAGFLLAMLPRSQSQDTPHTTAHLHSLNGLSYSDNAMVKEIDGEGQTSSVNYRGHFEVSCAAQIVSHVSYISLYLSDSMRTVDVSSSCGQLGFDVQGYSGMKCIQAVAFEHSCRFNALPVYVVINRCTHSVTASIDTSSHEGTPMRTLSYGSSDHGWAKVDELLSFHHPWHRGPLKPSLTTDVISETTKVTFPEVSLTVVEFASTGASTDCPAIYPEHAWNEQACDDIATPYWTRQGKGCDDIPLAQIQTKCIHNNGWKKNGYCRLTCCRAGHGYNDSPCKCQPLW